MSRRQPNVIMIMADQWRAQATGYNGDPNVRTPHLDDLAAQSIDFTNAVSGTPVCCPARASLLTGQYPLQHGVYINDVELKPKHTTLGESFKRAGYSTGYIGKWHLYGSPDGHYGRRSDPVPAEKRFGFEYWKAAECTHDYNESFYFAGDDPTRRYWDGYDAEAQTSDACQFVAAREDNPYFLMVSYGPPHFPLETAPEQYQSIYRDSDITLRGNVPSEIAEDSIRALRGYYAHIAALDDCIGRLLATVETSGHADNTIVVFLSDHGDMMGSQGIQHDVKVCPWEESLRIPFLIRYPARFGVRGRKKTDPANLPDVMPTILNLCDIEVPDGVTGADILGDNPPGSAFISMPVPILWARTYGIAEYRGVRDAQYTYIRSIDGPWLLYDNSANPLQIHNQCGDPTLTAVQQRLDQALNQWLDTLHDEFLPARQYLQQDGLTHYFEVNNPVGISAGPGKASSPSRPPPASTPGCRRARR